MFSSASFSFQSARLSAKRFAENGTQVITDIGAKAETARCKTARVVGDGAQVISDIRAKAESIKGKVQSAVAPEGETPPAVRAHAVPTTVATKVTMKKQHLENICALGYSEASAKFALERKNGNPDEAVMWLLEYHHVSKVGGLADTANLGIPIAPANAGSMLAPLTPRPSEHDGRGLGTTRRSWIKCPPSSNRYRDERSTCESHVVPEPAPSISSCRLLQGDDDQGSDEDDEQQLQHENDIEGPCVLDEDSESRPDAASQDLLFTPREKATIGHRESAVQLDTSDSVRAYIHNITLKDRRSFPDSRFCKSEDDVVLVRDLVVVEEPANDAVSQAEETTSSPHELPAASASFASVFHSAKLFAKRCAEDRHQVFTEFCAKAELAKSNLKGVSEEGTQANADMHAKAEAVKGKVQTVIAAASAVASAAKPGIDAVSSVTWNRIEQLTSREQDASEKENVERICALGFSVAAATFALEQSGGNPDAACEWLLEYKSKKNSAVPEPTAVPESTSATSSSATVVEVAPQLEACAEPIQPDGTTNIENEPCYAEPSTPDLSQMHAQMEAFMAGASLESLPLLTTMVATENSTNSPDVSVPNKQACDAAMSSDGEQSDGSEPELAPVEPPQSSSWDWPLTCREKQTRVQFIERQVHMLDQQALIQELDDLKRTSLSGVSSLENSMCEA